eukprot:321171_1
MCNVFRNCDCIRIVLSDDDTMDVTWCQSICDDLYKIQNENVVIEFNWRSSKPIKHIETILQRFRSYTPDLEVHTCMNLNTLIIIPNKIIHKSHYPSDHSINIHTNKNKNKNKIYNSRMINFIHSYAVPHTLYMCLSIDILYLIYQCLGDVNVVTARLMVRKVRCPEISTTCDVNCINRHIPLITQLLESNIMLDVDIKTHLSSYLHLISIHNKDYELQFIYQKLQHCNISKCVICKNLQHFAQISTNLYEYIIARIHYYFYHSYDIVHKLNNERVEILSCIRQLLLINDKDVSNTVKPLKMLKILSVKNSEYLDIETGKNKCRLTLEKKPDKYKTKENIFRYGFEFIYEKRYEYNPDMIVPKMYENFKDEMLNNGLSREQFETELEKAWIHYNSMYRRENFKYILTQHLLSVMFWCNFYELSTTLAATYTKISSTDTKLSVIKRHASFYHLGKYLKEAVTIFGTNICDGHIKHFYWGISEVITFPKLFSKNGVNIFAPIHASSSYAVAANYTNNNNGMIVEFMDGACGNPSYPVKYFAVDWLSDYGSESGYLFMQLKYGGLQFRNIILAISAIEMSPILTALRFIEDITNGIYIHNLTGKERMLTKRLIQHQLSFNTKEFQKQRMKSLHPYAQEMMNIYFKNKKQCVINWNHWKLDSMKSLEVYFDKYLMLIFPNINSVTIMEGKEIKEIFDFVLFENLELVTLGKELQGQVQIQSFIKESANKLKDSGLNISDNDDDDKENDIEVTKALVNIRTENKRDYHVGDSIT